MRGKAGASLPVVFPQLEAVTAKFRRGQVTLIASGPGCGKSIFAYTIARKSELPTLYFSADSDAFTMATRAAAQATGHLLEQVQKTFEVGNAAAVYRDVLDYPNLRLDFASAPSVDDIQEGMECFAIAYGQWPEILIVDNLRNVYNDELDGYQAYEATLEWLHDAGRETGAAIIALHHLTGKYENGNTPPPLDALDGKVGKIPEMVLTLHRTESNYGSPMLGACVVKNRGGKAAADGSFRTVLPFAPEVMRIGDLNA